MQEQRKAATVGGKDQKENAVACKKQEHMLNQNPV